jgi:hypothetical protein
VSSNNGEWNSDGGLGVWRDAAAVLLRLLIQSAVLFRFFDVADGAGERLRPEEVCHGGARVRRRRGRTIGWGRVGQPDDIALNRTIHRSDECVQRVPASS